MEFNMALHHIRLMRTDARAGIAITMNCDLWNKYQFHNRMLLKFLGMSYIRMVVRAEHTTLPGSMSLWSSSKTPSNLSWYPFRLWQKIDRHTMWSSNWSQHTWAIPVQSQPQLHPYMFLSHPNTTSSTSHSIQVEAWDGLQITTGQ